MIADHFEYRDLALTVDRGKVGDPSIVTLDWVTVDEDGQEHDRKLVVACELLIDKVENVRELTIVSVSGMMMRWQILTRRPRYQTMATSATEWRT